MKICKKILCIVMIVAIFSSISMTAFADHTRVVDLDEKQLYEHMMKVVVSETVDMNEVKKDTSVFNTFTISFLSSEIKDFIHQYEPEYEDDITDAQDKFYSYIDDIQEKEQKSRPEISDNTIIEYTNERKSFWTYDESKDSYVCKDENGKLLKSIPKYHLDDEESSSTQTSSSVSNENSSSNDNNTAKSDSDTVSAVSGNDSKIDSQSVGSAEISTDTVSPKDDVAVSAEVEEDPKEESTDEFLPDVANSNNTQQILLIIIGVLILAGIVVIIVMLIKKKKLESK